MQTLFIISSSAFGIAALIWFFTWALWIHPPEGWLGKQVVSVWGTPEIRDVREMAWFRWLRIATIFLGLMTFALLAAMIAAHPW